MFEIQDILANFDLIEILIVKVFGLIGLLMICFLVLRSHFQSSWEIEKQNQPHTRRKKKGSVTRKKSE